MLGERLNRRVKQNQDRTARYKTGPRTHNRHETEARCDARPIVRGQCNDTEYLYVLESGEVLLVHEYGLQLAHQPREAARRAECRGQHA